MKRRRVWVLRVTALTIVLLAIAFATCDQTQQVAIAMYVRSILLDTVHSVVWVARFLCGRERIMG
ncbi:MAG: hypothetical protein U0836_26050 [Pirellulales bacterium]